MKFSDPYAAPCAMLVMLERVANRWAILVLALVYDRPIRFNQLRRDLGGVSQKMLSQTLKALERDGLIHREVIPSVPIMVEYSITPRGSSLLETFRELQSWTDTRYPEVLQARDRFDRAQYEPDAMAA